MKGDIVKSDTRLLLFRALDYGLAAAWMDDGFVKKARQESVMMAFAFAKRYYSVVYEAHLRHASHCVLGIINLGLMTFCGNLPPEAADLLLKVGVVGAFREGWARILMLVNNRRAADPLSQHTAYEWEKDFADAICAEPGRKWIGYDEYRYLMGLYGKEAGK